MMKKILLSITSLCTMLTLFSFSAFAEPSPGAVRSACKDDVEKFCKDVKLGGGRIIECLVSKQDQLSAQCKTVIDEIKAKQAQKSTSK